MVECSSHFQHILFIQTLTFNCHIITLGQVAKIDLIMFLGSGGLKVSYYWKFCVDFKSKLLAKPSLGKS